MVSRLCDDDLIVFFLIFGLKEVMLFILVFYFF